MCIRDRAHRLPCHQVKPEFNDIGPLLLRNGSLSWIGERGNNLHGTSLLACRIKKVALLVCIKRREMGLYRGDFDRESSFLPADTCLSFLSEDPFTKNGEWNYLLLRAGPDYDDCAGYHPCSSSAHCPCTRLQHPAPFRSCVHRQYICHRIWCSCSGCRYGPGPPLCPVCTHLY